MIAIDISDVANGLLTAGAQFISAVDDPEVRESIATAYVKSITETMNAVCGLQDDWTPERVLTTHLETFREDMDNIRAARDKITAEHGDANWPTVIMETDHGQ